MVEKFETFADFIQTSLSSKLSFGVGLKLAFLMLLLKDAKSAPATSLKPPMFEETSSSSASRAMPHFQKLISNLKVRFSKIPV